MENDEPLPGDARTDQERAAELIQLLREGALLGVNAQLWLLYHWPRVLPEPTRQDAVDVQALDRRSPVNRDRDSS